jgi:uncharacterized protein (DUF1778 family)
MGQSDSRNREDKWIGLRVDPEKKRLVRMRAADLGLTVSEYLEQLVDEDLETVSYE